MNKSELAREMMGLAIADAGVSTSEFIDRRMGYELPKEYVDGLMARARRK